MIGQGLSERRSLSIVAMSASAYRTQKRPDRNVELRESWTLHNATRATVWE